jgi:hypothetical protein
VFCNLQGETIPKTPLFEEMFSDFDNLHKQLRTKQKSDNFQGKKQAMFNFQQVVSEEEAKKVFDVLRSTKQKIKSDDSRNTQTEFGRNKEIQITYGRRKLFDCINHPNPILNLSFDNSIFIQNTLEEIDPNLMKKDINPNQVFILKFLKDNSFEEMWCCNIKDVVIKDVKNKPQNLKRIPVIKNGTLQIYQDIWPFHHKAPAALRRMKVFSKLQGEKIPMTPLFDEMFSDFDNLHKQLLTKQKNDDFQGKKQAIVNLKQVVSEEESEKSF